MFPFLFRDEGEGGKSGNVYRTDRFSREVLIKKIMNSNAKHPGKSNNSIQVSRGAGQVTGKPQIEFPTNIEDLPLVNTKLNTINLYLNWINTWRSKYLLNKVGDLSADMALGKEKLEEIEASVSGLTSTVEEQNNDIYFALENMKQQLEDQKRVIESREKQIESLKLSQFHRDGVIDSSAFVFSYFVVNSPLVKLPLDLVLYVLYALPGINRILLRRRYTDAGVQLGLIYLIFSAIRNGAIERSLHSQTGNVKTYFWFCWNFLVRAGQSMASVGRSGVNHLTKPPQ